MPDITTSTPSFNDDPLFRTHKSRRLLTSLRFKTYSDAKLAGLFLENYFPITLFKKVFDLIVDPEFDSDDVTFEDIWDMFEYVSARRRKDGLKRGANAAVAPLEEYGRDDESPSQGQTAIVPGGIPRDILDLVVDQLVDDQLPLGIAAMDPQSTNALYSNCASLRNMSLVHRSWTSPAQRGLRRRAVIPIQHITDFLLSPLCGPWITEMIIYWSFDNNSNNGDDVVVVGATKGDIWALESLLERTPNVRSLVFNTSSFVWNAGGNEEEGLPLPPPPPPSDSWRIDMCLEIITDLLPNLENLWLKHHRPLTTLTTTTNPNEQSLDTCNELRSLYHYLPKLSSLKYLSIRWWSSDDNNSSDSDLQHKLNWDAHPPPKLKKIDLYLSGPGGSDIHKDDLIWLLKPRNNTFSLDSLSLFLEHNSLDFLSPSSNSSTTSLHAAMRDCLPGIQKSLKLVIRHRSLNHHNSGWGTPTDHGGPSDPSMSMFVPGQFYSNILKSASNLKNLELFFFGGSNLCSVYGGPFDLPPSLEILTIHLEDNDNYDRYPHPYPYTTTTSASTPTSTTSTSTTPASPSPKSDLDLHDLQVWFTSTGIEKFILERLRLPSSLPHLRKILITRSPPLDQQNTLVDWDLDALVYHMNENTTQRGQRAQRGDVISKSLHTILEERNIEFEFVDNAFLRGWDIPIPRGERHTLS